ncbi:Tox-REase-5 domain-containing protein [Archangium violaceum]|uniref:Tox-REase-5 domain-containing protein n=1 Tax=Archangium violaceum TaxID=83451 RepID=UPI0006991CBA|nr:Tox-REase-5 domain-containing protein [Archangium violaceum]
MNPTTKNSGGPSILALAVLVVLSGCATGRAGSAGSAGGFFEKADSFHVVQEASGLQEESRHPVGAALQLEQAHQLLGRLAKTPVTPRSFAPRRALCWLLGEVLEDGERVDYAELVRRTRRFSRLVMVRPDGYGVAALTGAPLQRLGQVKLEEGEWRVGRLIVGDFYFSHGGVLYPVNDVLRRANTPPWAELGLERDWFNAALDGSQDAMGEMAVALAHSVLHPIRTWEDLIQLPSSVALLIASSPEYFARYGAMSLQDQIREAARLSTHVLMLLGGGQGAVGTMGRMGGLGAELPVLSLSAQGELLLAREVVAAGTMTTTVGVELGSLSILHMAGGAKGNTRGGSGEAGKAPPPKGPGKWIYKKPTTRSEDALDYQEQVTGQPAWRVYDVDGVEFDGFTGKELQEAKGPNYVSFFNEDGTPKYWYKNSGKFDEMMDQALNQSKTAERVKLPLAWYVADPKVAEFLRKLFGDRGWKITIHHLSPAR